MPDHVELVIERGRLAIVADRTGRELRRRIELADRLDAAEHVVDFGHAAVCSGGRTDRRRRRAEAALEVVELARERRQVLCLVEHGARQSADLRRRKLAARHRADDAMGEPAVQVMDEGARGRRGIGRILLVVGRLQVGDPPVATTGSARLRSRVWLSARPGTPHFGMPYHLSSVARIEVASYATPVSERNTVRSSIHGETRMAHPDAHQVEAEAVLDVVRPGVLG